MATKSKPISVVDYAIARLVKAGVKDIFGIPGDFAFPWGDAVTKNKDMKWLGVSNELNGSYAADGYARVNGLAALATTYADPSGKNQIPQVVHPVKRVHQLPPRPDRLSYHRHQT